MAIYNCRQCGAIVPYSGAPCPSCARKRADEQRWRDQGSSSGSRPSATAQRSTETYRIYTDKFGNKVRTREDSGRFEVKTGLWGWSGDNFKGKAEYRYSNGDVYAGQVRGQFFDGKGKYTWANGAYYEGDFVFGKFSGYGIRVYVDGYKYEGQFKDNKRHGKGKLTGPNGITYDGDWAYDKKAGKGKYTWASGAYYEGEFVDGNFNGYGIRVYSDGYKYEGQFKDDKRHGKGVLTAPDGTVAAYYYENDKIVCGDPGSADPTPPKTAATPATEKKTAAAAGVKKVEPVVPAAQAVEKSAEESNEQKLWNSLLKMSADEKKAYFETHHELTVPAGTQVIPASSFQLCAGLNKVHFNDDLREIGEHAFYGAGLKAALMIPKSVSKIGVRAFATCRSIQKIILPNDITVEQFAFAYINALTEVEFETDPPQGVVLNHYAFSRCHKYSLKSKEMIEKIKRLNANAFK